MLRYHRVRARLLHARDARELPLGLLVRQFEQRKVLDTNARKVQFLVRPHMCRMYRIFYDLLKEVSRCEGALL